MVDIFGRKQRPMIALFLSQAVVGFARSVRFEVFVEVIQWMTDMTAVVLFIFASLLLRDQFFWQE